jgi:hypothetical protein
MERSSRIWEYLQGASPEEVDRRGAILDGLLRAFSERGEEAATADLQDRMKDLEADFEQALGKLEDLLK